MAQARGRSRRVGRPQTAEVVVDIDDLVVDENDVSNDWTNVFDEDAEAPLRGLRERADSLLGSCEMLASDTPVEFMRLGDLPGLLRSDLRIVREAVNDAVDVGDPQYLNSQAVASNLQVMDACYQLQEIACAMDDRDVVEGAVDALETLLALISAFIHPRVRGPKPKTTDDLVKWKKKKSSKKALRWKPVPTIKERIRAAAQKVPPRRLRLRRVWDF